jgi:hypothetical protein
MPLSENSLNDPRRWPEAEDVEPATKIPRFGIER